MSARIPVFVSAPTALSPAQESAYMAIAGLLDDENLERRALGRTDFGVDFPLKEVYAIARHCSGGVILGFSQMRADRLTVKGGTLGEQVVQNYRFPTPWNNLEAGILFALKVPMMVFREDGIEGGVFDNGVSEVFVQRLPLGPPSSDEVEALKAAIKNWVGKVREHYRSY